MNLQCNDVSRCQRAEKVVREGLCLSYDLLRCLCLETMGPCVAMDDQTDPEEHP